MRIVGAEEEQDYGDAQKELFGRRVLVSIVDLLPHVEVIIGSSVELERYSANPVEHEEGAEHVGNVGECP